MIPSSKKPLRPKNHRDTNLVLQDRGQHMPVKILQDRDNRHLFGEGDHGPGRQGLSLRWIYPDSAPPKCARML